MKKMRLIIQGIIISICIGCSTNQKKDVSIPVIDIGSNANNWKEVYLSSFVDSIRYIPLENVENLSLNNIVQADFSDSLILVSDVRNCLLYDNKGNFISKIGNKGRGPGEYQYISNLGIGFGPATNIYISSSKDLYEYDKYGSFKNKYVKSLSINDTSAAFKWRIIYDSLFFGHIPNNTGKMRYKAVIKNKYGNVLNIFRNYDSFYVERVGASDFENHVQIYQFKGSIFYKEFYNDTLFNLNNQNELIARYVIDLGKYKLQNSERSPQTGESVFNHLVIWYTFQTEDYIFINCQFGNYFPAKRLTARTFGPVTTFYNTTYALGIYDKKSRDLFFCKPTSTDNFLFTTGIYNDMDAGPRFFPNMQINDSTMVMYMTIDELKAHIKSNDFKDNIPKFPEKKKLLEEMVDSLSILDNPVLMFVTFKKKD